jgi:hypothetical protein
LKKKKSGLGQGFKDLERLEEHSVALVTVSSENYNEIKFDLLKRLLKKEKHGIYVSINRTVHSLKEELEREKIKADKLYFIDCVSEQTGNGKAGNKNVSYINTAQNLTDLGIELVNMMEKCHDCFVFFDAITALTLYHNTDVVGRFFHILNEKVRTSGSKGFLINVDDAEEEELTELVSQFCDLAVFFNK